LLEKFNAVQAVFDRETLYFASASGFRFGRCYGSKKSEIVNKDAGCNAVTDSGKD